MNISHICTDGILCVYVGTTVDQCRIQMRSAHARMSYLYQKHTHTMMMIITVQRMKAPYSTFITINSSHIFQSLSPTLAHSFSASTHQIKCVFNAFRIWQFTFQLGYRLHDSCFVAHSNFPRRNIEKTKDKQCCYVSVIWRVQCVHIYIYAAYGCWS